MVYARRKFEPCPSTSFRDRDRQRKSVLSPLSVEIEGIPTIPIRTVSTVEVSDLDNEGCVNTYTQQRKQATLEVFAKSSFLTHVVGRKDYLNDERHDKVVSTCTLHMIQT